MRHALTIGLVTAALLAANAEEQPKLAADCDRWRGLLGELREQSAQARQRYARELLGRVRDRAGKPVPEARVARVLDAQDGLLQRWADEVESARLLAESGRIAADALREKLDAALLECVIGMARLSRDEATQRLAVLEAEAVAELGELRTALAAGGAAARPDVARREADLARRTRRRFRELALTLAAARLQQLALVEQWSRWRHPQLEGLHADFAGPLDLHLALGDVEGPLPQVSSFQSLLEQCELTLPGVCGPPLRLSLVEHFERLNLAGEGDEPKWPAYSWREVDRRFVRGVEVLRPNLPRYGEPDPEPWGEELPAAWREVLGPQDRVLLIYGSQLLDPRGKADVFPVPDPRPAHGAGYGVIWAGEAADLRGHPEQHAFWATLETRISPRPRGAQRLDRILDDQLIVAYARLPAHAEPGVYALRIPGVARPVEWYLRESPNQATPSFQRLHPQRGLQPTHTAYVQDELVLEVRATSGTVRDRMLINLGVGGKPARIDGQEGCAIPLERVGEDGRVFRSRPLRLVAEDAPPEDAGDYHVVRVRPGGWLSAFLPPGSPVRATTPALARLYRTPAEAGGGWVETMREVVADYDLKVPTGETRESSLDQVSMLITPTLFKREIPIRLGHVASMLLLQRRFLRDMRELDASMQRLREQARDDPRYARAWAERMRGEATRPGSALGSLQVTTPGKIGTTGFRDAFNEVYLRRVFKGSNTERAVWRELAASQALDAYCDAVSKALKHAEAASPDDLRALLQLTGTGFEAIQASVQPDLLRLRPDPVTGRVRWLPDELAELCTAQIPTLYDEYRDNEKLRKAELDVILAVAGLPIFGGEVLALRVAALVIQAATTTVFVLDELPKHFAKEAELEFALGALEVLGHGRLIQAEHDRGNQALLWFDLLGNVFGLGGELIDLAKTLRAPRQAARLQRLVAEVEQEGVTALARFSHAERATVAECLSLAQRAELDGGRIPRWFEPFEQRAAALGQRLGQRLEALDRSRFYRSLESDRLGPSPRGARRPSSTPESVAGVGLGEVLGRGVEARVFATVGEEFEGYVFAQCLQPEAAEAILHRNRYVSGLLEEHGVPHLRVHPDRGVLEEGYVRGFLQERAPPGSRILHYEYVPEHYLAPGGLARQWRRVPGVQEFGGHPLPRNMQRAVLELFRDLGRAGLIWEDAHLGNLYFFREGPTWRAGILDLDRVVPFDVDVRSTPMGSQAEVFWNLQDSPGIETSFYRNSIHSMAGQRLPPGAGYALRDLGKHVYPDAEFFMQKILEYKWFIRYDREGARWLDSVLEVEVVEEFFPELRQHVDPDIVRLRGERRRGR